MQIFDTNNFMGNGKNNFFTGVVEDNNDPSTLLRVKVRIHVYHTEDKSLLPTNSLPWAIVLQPTTNSSISGIGNSQAPLAVGAWVFGMFLDELYQQPMVIGTLPGIHRPQAPGSAGNTDGGYLNDGQQGQYKGTPPYHGGGGNLPNDAGNTLRDNGQYLTDSDKSNWPLKYYTTAKANAGGLACNGTGINRMHKSTALAFEELVKQFGKGKLGVNSAYRSPGHNAREGGAKSSLHMQGRALDVSYPRGIGTSKAEKLRFAKFAAKNGFVGFGLYPTFMHIDTGTGRVWYKGGDISQGELQAAIKESGWVAGKQGLQGTKTETATANTSPTQTANNAPGSTAGSPAADGTPTDAKSVKNNETRSTADRIQSKFSEAGYSPAAIAAVKAHGSAESNLDPTRINPNDVGKESIGIFQYRDDRNRALRTYAAQQGKDWRDTDVQLDYTLKEMAPGGIRSSAGAALRNAKTPEEAHAAMSRYEGYKGYNDPSSKEYQKRLASTNSVYNGSVPPEKRGMPGFNDPTNSLPYSNYKGKPSTNEAVRGINGNVFQASHMARETGKMTGLPIAGNKGTFGEPENSFAPQYPHNTVTATKSGHTIELDDTPGAERIQITHKSGTTSIISAKGTKVDRVIGNSYKMDSRDSYHGVQGDFFMTAVGDISMRSTTDITIQSDGSKTEMVYNDQSTLISGNFDISIGETLQIKANKIIIEGTDIDIYAKGNLSFHAEGDINMKGKNINVEASAGLNAKSATTKMSSSGNTSIKAPTVYMDDIVRMAEGGATDADAAKDAKSTDIGKAAPRKNIKKNATPSENPDSYVTSEDAYGVYST